MPMSTCQLVTFSISYDYQRPDSLQGKLLMSLTYGYDMTDGDKILEPSLQLIKMLAPLTLPGGALVNYLPFCAGFNFISATPAVPHSDFIFSATHSFLGPILQL